MVILALLAVIGGPIIINECYKGDSGGRNNSCDDHLYTKATPTRKFSQKRNRKVVKYRKNNCSNTGCDQSHSPFT